MLKTAVRNAEENGRLSPSISLKGSHEHLNVLQDGFVGHTCETTVNFGIHVFQIDQHQFATTCHTFHHIRVSVKRSIYSAMETTPPEFVEQFANVIGVHQRFATAEGDTASAVLHDVAFLLHLLHQFFHTPFATANLECLRRTSVGILSPHPIDHTGVASDATVATKHNLRFRTP